ncbi:DUF6264 family protein [Microbacterium sp.]|uniref:DUF6264 family protein n=1 Tax=Microbacterium sp. TaxID=51671 RepID=UPI003A86AAC0
MTDPDDRPQYGEYATPEEQPARIADSGADGAEPAYHPHPPTAPATTSAARPVGAADRIVTLVLLAYGLFTVVSTIPQVVDFSGFVDTWMEVVGIDAVFTNQAQGRQWGIIVAVVLVAGWALTAALSWWSLRRRRVSWWIPLVGALVTYLIAGTCAAVPLLGDPAVVEHLTSLS